MFHLAGKTIASRLICGTALFPSPDIMQQAIIASGADAVTVSLRRQLPEAGGGSSFWNLIAYCAGTGGSILVIGLIYGGIRIHE